MRVNRSFNIVLNKNQLECSGTFLNSILLAGSELSVIECKKLLKWLQKTFLFVSGCFELICPQLAYKLRVALSEPVKLNHYSKDNFFSSVFFF